MTPDTYVWETEDGGLVVTGHRFCWYAEAGTNQSSASYRYVCVQYDDITVLFLVRNDSQSMFNLIHHAAYV
jgi:hypothetical protein